MKVISNFLSLLKEITSKGISIDLIGIGFDLDVENAEQIADIKKITVNTALKQEDFQKILVDDFEFNFFPIVKNVKIEFLSSNLKLLKTYGTGYKNPEDKKEELKNEESLMFKNQIKESKWNLIYFDLIRKKLKSKCKRISYFVMENIVNFLKFSKKDVAEFDKLTRSAIKISENHKIKETKIIKGNMILLKIEIEDLELHRK